MVLESGDPFQTRFVEPHGHSPWHPTSRPSGATSRPNVGAFIHGHSPWPSAAGVNLSGEKDRHITREVSKHQTSDGLGMAAIEAVCNAKDPGEPLDKLTAVGIELCDIGQQGRTRIDPPHRGRGYRASGSGRGSACGVSLIYSVTSRYRAAFLRFRAGAAPPDHTPGGREARRKERAREW